MKKANRMEVESLVVSSFCHHDYITRPSFKLLPVRFRRLCSDKKLFVLFILQIIETELLAVLFFNPLIYPVACFWKE